MYVEVLKSKIHRVTITEANLNYVGSITIDEDLMDAANIIAGEKVQIVDNNNGARPHRSSGRHHHHHGVCLDADGGSQGVQACCSISRYCNEQDNPEVISQQYNLSSSPTMNRIARGETQAIISYV